MSNVPWAQVSEHLSPVCGSVGEGLGDAALLDETSLEAGFDFISSLHSSSLLCLVLTAGVSIQLPALPSLPPSCHASQPSWTFSPLEP